jgi:glycosyltransferase involved in cell wall biosynthesis
MADRKIFWRQMSNSLKIGILDCTKTIYNEETSEKIPLGGIERCIVSLSRALHNKKCDVRVFSNVKEPYTFKNITWYPEHLPTDFKSDITIACNDSKLLNQYAFNSKHTQFKPYLWHHNPVGLWKTIRKGRLFPIVKWNPVHILLGAYHTTTCPIFLPHQKNIIIEHGIEDSILADSYNDTLRPPHVAFISQAYRGLEDIIRIWKHYVFPQNNLAKLFVYSDFQCDDKDALSKFGILIVGRLPRHELINHLKEKRLVVIPGHKDETFCLSALESLCLGIPVITFGFGSLKERVQNDFNGFIVNDDKEFAQKIDILLKDNTIWQEMSKNALLSRNNASWAEKADIWLSHFESQKHE